MKLLRVHAPLKAPRAEGAGTVVRYGIRITDGGVNVGIELALSMVAELAGPAVAQETPTTGEYGKLSNAGHWLSRIFGPMSEELQRTPTPANLRRVLASASRSRSTLLTRAGIAPTARAALEHWNWIAGRTATLSTGHQAADGHRPVGGAGGSR